jgi:hypothetical protein
MRADQPAISSSDNNMADDFDIEYLLEAPYKKDEKKEVCMLNEKRLILFNFNFF